MGTIISPVYTRGNSRLRNLSNWSKIIQLLSERAGIQTQVTLAGHPMLLTVVLSPKGLSKLMTPTW